MLTAYDNAKIRYASREWDSEARENYNRILVMEDNLIKRYYLSDDALADCHCSPEDSCGVHNENIS